MRTRALLLGGMVVIAMTSVASALSSVHVDFGTPSSPVAAGYVAITSNSIRWDQGTQASLGSGVLGGWLTSTLANAVDRTAGSTDPLLRDFALWYSPNGGTFKVTGLVPGSYNLTIYGNDTQYRGSVLGVAVDGNNDSVNDATFTIDQKNLGQTSNTVPVTVSSAGILLIVFSAPTSSNCVCNGFDLVNAAPDTTPPTAVTNLAVTATTALTASLSWTAPSDDNGTVSSYDLRYSTSPITDGASFAAASAATGAPAPAAAGQTQTFTVTGLVPSTLYYFAIKSADPSNNISALSNVPTGITAPPDITAPGAIADLTTTGTTSGSVSLRWTAPSDVDSPVSGYDIRYSTSAITDASFAAATRVTDAPAPAAPGTQESFTVSSLNPTTTYHFAIKSADTSNNISAISNGVSGTTLGLTNIPVAKLDFQASATGNVTAPGYIGIDPSFRWDATGQQVDLGYGRKGAWTKTVIGEPRDRLTADPLLRDFMMWLIGNKGDTFQFGGLRPGDYNVKIYSTDTVYGGSKTSIAFDGNNDGAADTTITIQASLSETAKTASVTVSSAGILSIAFTPYGGSAVCNGLDLIYTTLDAIPPAPVVDLAASDMLPRQVKLQWTAPADDNGTWGWAASYDMRYSTAAITDANWDTATQVAGEPIPSAAGRQDSMVISGLTGNTTYHFAVKSADSSGNISPLSNVLQVITPMPDITSPSPVTDLAASAVGPNWVKMTWTATGDDGMVGTADHYELRYSTAPITDATWASASLVGGLAAPKAPGSPETFTLHGLAATTQYYFAIRVIDEWPNFSPLSNVISPITLAADTQPPLAIGDLKVTGMYFHDAFLAWTAPADQGTAGCGSYDVRYSTSPITGANWSSATKAVCSLVPAAPGGAERFTVSGLSSNTTYYFAVKTLDYAEPVANTSAISNVVIGITPLPPAPVTVHNPWITNDRVADCRTLASMAATFDKAYTPDGVIVPDPADAETRVINEYNNVKRRLYHWGLMPPNNRDVVEQMNVYGWALCGSHAAMNSAILTAMGLHSRTISISNGDHTIYEVNYNGGWHCLDTMSTYYVWSRTNPRYLVSMEEVRLDKTLADNAVAEGRTCPGWLLCGDTVTGYSIGADTWAVVGDPGNSTTTKSMNMDLRIGESISRTWQSWANQYTALSTTPPYHHESNKDWKDVVNIPYWEPYQLTSAQSTALGITMSPTYRRWANGTYILAPDFRSPAYQASLVSSTNIATYNDDSLDPDLHVAVPGTTAEAVFKIVTPFMITDATVDGTFLRTNSGDVTCLFGSKDGVNWTKFWDNSSLGTTQLSNLSFGSLVTGQYQCWVKIQVKATNARTDAGISNFVITATFEHNKGGLPYLDKGVNHITVTLDNPADLASGNGAVFKITYSWKEYDGADWTILKTREQYITASPTTFTITAGGTKVPRTEYIKMEVAPLPPPDSYAPSPITDLAVGSIDTNKVGLAWTATGDDGLVGQATSYDIRYSNSPITKDNFDAASEATNLPVPQVAGSPESFSMIGLVPSTTYYFAIKAQDEGGNKSDISNLVGPVTTLPPDVTPPVWVTNLVARGSKTAGSVDLTWIASGDDANVGTAASYDLRYSTSPISEANFGSATTVPGLLDPKAAGSAESFTVTGLTGGTFYYFGLRVTDESGNASEISNTTYAFASMLGEKTLQYGLNGYAATKDNYVVASDPTVPYGDRERMRICGFADSGPINRQRGFIQFDVSSIPAGTAVTGATLCLYAYDPAALKGSSGFYGLYALARDFDQLTSCWNLARTGVSWTTPGGDFTATADATSPKQGVAGVWYTFEVTARVQAWLAAPGTNFGWLLKCTDENLHNQDCFYALDTSNATLRPKLVVSDLPAAIAGDVTGDGSVDVVDLLFFVESFGRVLGDRGHDPKCDFNGDQSVDVVDLLTMVENWGL